MNKQKNTPNGKSSFDLIDQEKFFREMEIKEDTREPCKISLRYFR